MVLPIAKYAFYAGTLNYENTLKLYQLFDELKCFLRTNGDGWEKPMNISSISQFFATKNLYKHHLIVVQQLDIKPLPPETPSTGVNPCKGLILYEHLRNNPPPPTITLIKQQSKQLQPMK